MALIYGVTATEARRSEDVNQIGRALRLVLGITATDQDALGRLVFPRRSGAPGSPSEGQAYYDTDDSRIYYRTASAWIPWDVTRGAQRFDLERDIGVGRTFGRILEERVTLNSANGIYIWEIHYQAAWNGAGTEEGFDIYSAIDDSAPLVDPSALTTWVPRLHDASNYQMTQRIAMRYSGLTHGEHAFRLFGATTALQRGSILGWDDYNNRPRTSLTILELGG